MEDLNWEILLLSLLYPLKNAELQKYCPIKPGDYKLATANAVSAVMQEFENTFFAADLNHPLIRKACETVGYPLEAKNVQPAAAIFSSLSLTGARAALNTVYPLEPLAAANAFPTAAPGNDLQTLMSLFRTDFTRAVETAADAESLFRMCTRIMEHYTWCLQPVNGWPGVSLYDYATLLSAVTACLLQSSAEMTDSPAFVLLSADFSGIQKYIFRGSGLHKGAAKKLRARSFMVSSILRLMQHIVLKEFGLPLTCTLMNSGGNLHILLPDTPATVARCDRLRQAFDKEIYDRFYGDVAVHIVTTQLMAEDFLRFGQIMQKARESLHKAKCQAFHGQFAKKGVWNVSHPLRIPGNSEAGLCKGCEKAFAEKETARDNDALCPQCNTEQKIGSKLAKASAVSIIPGSEEEISLGDWSLKFGCAGTDVFALHGGDSKEQSGNGQAGEKTRLWPLMRTANYVPTDKEGQIITFDGLVQYAQGAKKLAVLKADVDRMGALFAYGFATEDQPQQVSALQIITLSRMLEYFFGDYLHNFLASRFKHCYTIFSGGDDLVMVGPWQDIVKLALEMQQKFTQYCGENKEITISAGITLFSYQTPISFTVQEAERALVAAKENGDQMQKIRNKSEQKPEGRNQLCLFRREMKWERAHVVLAWAKQVADWYENKKLSSGDLYKMRKWAIMFQDYLKKNDSLGLKYAALAAYDLGKKLENDKQLSKEIVKFWESLQEILPETPIHHLQVICDYALFRNRRQENE